VVFDPDLIDDKATFEKPLQFAVGVEQVFVNGVQVISNSEHTDKFPGRFVKGSGFITSN
jgi:N-acyl-D-amino-acid deacylase